MTFEELQGQVQGESEYIPTWPKEHQSELRALYMIRRQRSLGKDEPGNQSAGDVLCGCLAKLSADHPDAVFKFNAEFFGVQAPAGA